MLYLISDIHGNLIGFKKLLKQINFNRDKDRMVILGDVIDRGESSIELLDYLKPMINDGSVKLLMGNHEMFCVMYLDGTLDARKWSMFGGKDTLRSVDRMSVAEKEELKAFLKGLPLYSKGHSEFLGDFICTHSGLHADCFIRNEAGVINVQKSIEEAYEKHRYNFMCGMDLHYLAKSDKEMLDTYLIVGHVPCNRLREEIDDFRFVRTPYYMDIDAGSGHVKGKLGCYIVDTDEEIYIDMK